MKFLTDQDVFGATVRFLIDLGYDVVPVARIGLAQASDSDLLYLAHEQAWIPVTRDRDFGSLVFVNHLGAGVMYLRVVASNQNAVHHELERVLKTYSESELMDAFVVVEAGRHRFRRLSSTDIQNDPN